MLQLKNIVKKYVTGDLTVTALNDVSINFRRNEFVSILGPSGCGKTTMLNIIGGLDKYTSGDLVIDGVSTKEFKSSDWDTYRNNRIGFIFQSYNLIPHQSVVANVEMALTLSGVGRIERRRRALEVLNKVGLKREAFKRPNQLSGGQMQRVAIARALVNDPEIILADEPTGALDTETSIQVMDLLKEVAKDRLVIMVTHNPDLAERYSTRIIRFLDGVKVGDTDEFDGMEKTVHKETVKGKAQMKLHTAFSLSLSNLRTKFGRTLLTSVAGSIGIIGIALVLAVSTGFGNYVDKLQGDTLSVYPVTISEATVDFSDFDKLLADTGLERFPEVKKVYTRQMFSNLTGMLKSNNISEEYMNYVNAFVDEQNEKALSTDEKWRYSISKSYGLDVNNYIWANIGMKVGEHTTYNVMPVDMLVKSLEGQMAYLSDSDLNITPEFVREYIPTMSQLPDSRVLLDSQYDVLEGTWPQNKYQVVLVLGDNNDIADITMALLGMRTIDGLETNADGVKVTFGGNDTFTFDEMLNYKFYYVKNADRYTKVNNYFMNGYLQNFFSLEEGTDTPLPESAVEMQICGIVRRKPDVQEGVLGMGIAYTSDFVSQLLVDCKQANDEGITDFSNGANVYNPLMLTDMSYKGTNYSARQLGVDDTISKLSFYSIGYDAKEELKVYLDKWNDMEGRAKEDEVHFSDSTAMLFYALNTIVDAVKIVLICFTSISLVVSSIMIGIITYVSVVERTKEIGVLRSIGARKKDISRIFNAETFLVGLFAGIIGVAMSYLLSIPINLIAERNMSGLSSIASLRFTDALLLVAVSFVLTIIAGLIPSRIAANKDPVICLRTE